MRRVSILIVALLLARVVTGGQPVEAANFSVTKTTDSADGTCDSDCSLREAITAANSTPGADTVFLPACGLPTSPCPYTLSIAGANEDANATGDLDVTDALTIEGGGSAVAIIDASGLDRAIDNLPGFSLTLRGLQVRNGNVPGEGGGLRNGGTLTIESSQITDNTSSGDGGGIMNVAGSTLILRNSAVANSDATGNGGGIMSQGPGGLTLIESNVFGNSAAGNGGGIYIAADVTATVGASAISDNAAANGSGISNNQCCGAPPLAITNSAIVRNTATAAGGGIQNASASATELTNVTISTNAAANGGGMRIQSETSAFLTNVTVASNSAGGGLDVGGQATLKNSIVAANATSNCIASQGVITSLGHNLEDAATCGFTSTGDLSATDPQLEPLALNPRTEADFPAVNYSSSDSHALASTSPARNGGDNTGCPTTDQRFVERPQEGVCDIGAYEYRGPAAMPPATPAPTQAPIALPPTGGQNSAATGGALIVGLAMATTALFAGAWAVRISRG